jgi:hypothetical protein
MEIAPRSKRRLIDVEHGRPLYRDRAEKDRLEAQNARLQYRRVLELIPLSRGEPEGGGHRRRLTPETIKDLHHAAIRGI